MANQWKIEKLSRDVNFGLWQVKMHAILVQQEVEDVLEGIEKLPKELSDQDKLKLDRKAMSTIRLSLSDEVLREVLKEETAASLWKRLEEVYMKKSLASRIILKKKLFLFKMKSGVSLQQHLDDFNAIIMDLEKVEAKFSDEDQAILLLCSLSSSYDHFVETMMYSRTDISLADVKNALSSKSDMEKRSDGSESSKSEALVARGKGKERSFSKNTSKTKSRDKDIICHYCKKKGHKISECFKLQNKEKQLGSGSGDHSGSNVAESDSDFVLAATDSSEAADGWVIDTGSTFHLTPNKHWFSSYESMSGGMVVMGNGDRCEVAGVGSVRLRTHDGLVKVLSDVRHVPKASKNLISVGSLTAKGYKFSGEDDCISITKGSLILMKGKKLGPGKLYMLKGETVVGDAAVASSLSGEENAQLWHMRLGHMSEKGMAVLNKRGLFGSQKIGSLDFCEYCVLGKQKRVSFSAAKHTTKAILDYVHSDLWGPSQVPSKGGARYMLTFIDDFSRKTWVYILKQKSDVFQNFQQWKVMIENQTGKKIKILRTDNGLEFCSSEFDNFCKDAGIVRHRTVRHTPQQNGVAERLNRTLLERARCMLLNADLTKDFWAEAVCTACYLVNRSPHTVLDMRTPEEVWSGGASDLSKLRVFGCPAYAHVDQGKLNARSLKCIFLGYDLGVKGYRLWCKESQKLMVERNVVFNELSMLPSRKDTVISTPVSSGAPIEVEPPIVLADKDVSVTQGESSKSEEDEEYLLARDRERRLTKKPRRYAESVLAYALSAAEEIGVSANFQRQFRHPIQLLGWVR